MSEDTKTKQRLGGQYFGGVIAGIGVGLSFSSVLYRRFPVADIENALRLVSFLLLCGGVLYARYSRKREALAARTES